MSAPGRLRRPAGAAIAAGAVLSLCLVPAVSASATSRGSDDHGSKHGHARHHHHGNRVNVQLLSFNDFHGNLAPPSGSGGRITTGYTESATTPPAAVPTNVDAGGVEFLATHLRDARKGHRNSITVAAGDLIGASPLLSAAFHDEPTIEAMNELGLQVSAVGNHEFDEGFVELQRMQSGGCIDDGKEGENNQNSCADHRFRGADFQYLSANVKFSGTNRTILPAYTIKKVHGVKIGFIGMTLKETPTIVTKSGVEGLDFTDEVATANALVPVLHRKGVKAIVVLLHQGAVPNKTTFVGASGTSYSVDPAFDATCQKGGTLAQDSAILPIAENLDPEIDMIISGHTHQPYVCDIPDPRGNSRLVTSASSFGRLFTDTELTFDKRRGDIVRASVKGSNMVVTRDVAPAPDLTALIARYNTLVEPIATRKVGNITADVTRTATTGSGETALGDLIADAQKNDPSVVVNGQAPLIAFMNPGGIRADLTFAQSKAEGAGVVTFEEAFTVQPFNNFDVSMTMTGADIYELLNQQWTGLNAGTNAKVLQVSDGFSYQWSPSGGTPHVVPDSVKLGGTVIPNNASQSFRVTANNFLSDGGDNFAAFTKATDKVFGGLDIDAFANYLTAHPDYAPTALTRIVQVP